MTFKLRNLTLKHLLGRKSKPKKLLRTNLIRKHWKRWNLKMGKMFSTRMQTLCRRRFSKGNRWSCNLIGFKVGSTMIFLRYRWPINRLSPSPTLSSYLNRFLNTLRARLSSALRSSKHLRSITSSWISLTRRISMVRNMKSGRSSLNQSNTTQPLRI